MDRQNLQDEVCPTKEMLVETVELIRGVLYRTAIWNRARICDRLACCTLFDRLAQERYGFWNIARTGRSNAINCTVINNRSGRVYEHHLRRRLCTVSATHDTLRIQQAVAWPGLLLSIPGLHRICIAKLGMPWMC